MKKFFLALFVAFLSLGIASAQEINEVIETYNTGAMELDAGNKEGALTYFQDALMAAEALGDEGLEMAQKCKDIIPAVVYNIAKDLIETDDLTGASAKLKEALELAKEYGVDNVANSATSLLIQTLMSIGSTSINEKDYASAINTFEEILTIKPDHAMAALRLGMAYGASENFEEAEKAYLTASENGQEKQAKKQLSTLYVKRAAALLKEKDYQGALDFALKSNEALENATAMKVAGTAASSLKKDADALAYLEKYVELAPNAKDAALMKYNIGAIAQSLGDKAKARTYFQMAVSDPKVGAKAKQALDNLK